MRLINTLVLYVGTKMQSKAGHVAQIQDGANLDVFDALMTTLDAEGRYYVLNAIANQLRYPNSHSHLFSCLVLYLFLHSKQPVQEQITRVLLERYTKFMRIFNRLCPMQQACYIYLPTILG